MRAAPALVALADRVGLVTSYQATNGQWVQPDTEDLVATLGALGVELDLGAGGAEQALADWNAAEEAEPCPLVVVAWDGRAAPIPLRGAAFGTGTSAGTAPVLLLESGEAWWVGDGLARQGATLAFTRRLPFGRHELRFEDGAGELVVRSWIIAAPRVAWRPEAGQERRWGIFVPTYALRRTDQPAGVGDLADLEAAFDWLAARGGQAVVTLPMLATFLDEPAEYSPYAPVSRRFWNELFLDLRQVAARADVVLGPVESELVDYRAAWAPRRQVLAQLAHRLVDDGELAHWVSQNPQVDTYARFRAAGTRHGRDWRQWPKLRTQDLPHDVDQAEVRFHLTAQWMMERQLGRLARKVSARGQLLALDLPMGSHPDGFDVWQHQDLFVAGTSVGAPPDSFFTKGQDWGFPPIHPARSRATGHAFWQECVRHHVRHAGLLRVDHILGLLRLYWVRQGVGPAHGVYVRYPLDELLAIIALEAARAGAVVVGENLGTVPPEITAALTEHGILGCSVSQFDVLDLHGDPQHPLPVPSAASVATLNTHDTATFAAFWTGEEAEDRASLGLLDEQQLAEAKARAAHLRGVLQQRLDLGRDLTAESGFSGPGVGRIDVDSTEIREPASHAGRVDDRGAGLVEGEPFPSEIVRAAAALLGLASESDAALVILNVEDAWAEPKPQNVPGTTSERPNWQRRVAVPLEQWEDHPGLALLVAVITRSRPGWATRPQLDPPARPAADR